MQQQPYRAGGARGPSQILDSMKAGRAQGAGTALMSASNMAKSKPGKRKKGVVIPRSSTTRPNIGFRWPTA